MSNDNFQIADGVFICQVCKYYREKNHEACLDCKHIGDFLGPEQKEDTEGKSK